MLGDGCPSEVCFAQHRLNSGSNYVSDVFRGRSPPFDTTTPIKVPCQSNHDVLIEHQINHIDLLKVDTEGSEVAIFHCLENHGWLSRTKWIRFEWHGADSIQALRALISPTHVLSIDRSGVWNGIGVAHPKGG